MNYRDPFILRCAGSPGWLEMALHLGHGINRSDSFTGKLCDRTAGFGDRRKACAKLVSAVSNACR